MALEERVSRLEKQNRRLRLSLGALALVIAAGVVMGATKQTIFGETIKAQAFLVTDKSGKPRAVFGTIGGEASLELFDGNRRRRVSLAVSKDNIPGLRIYDVNGTTRIVLNVLQEKGAAIILADGFGKPKWSAGAGSFP
ncbi:MAG: hypothetical protein ACE5JS_19130 [Nitrospinota bacterium]